MRSNEGGPEQEVDACESLFILFSLPTANEAVGAVVFCVSQVSEAKR